MPVNRRMIDPNRASIGSLLENKKQTLHEANIVVEQILAGVVMNHNNHNNNKRVLPKKRHKKERHNYMPSNDNNTDNDDDDDDTIITEVDVIDVLDDSIRTIEDEKEEDNDKVSQHDDSTKTRTEGKNNKDDVNNKVMLHDNSITTKEDKDEAVINELSSLSENNNKSNNESDPTTLEEAAAKKDTTDQTILQEDVVHDELNSSEKTMMTANSLLGLSSSSGRFHDDEMSSSIILLPKLKEYDNNKSIDDDEVLLGEEEKVQPVSSEQQQQQKAKVVLKKKMKMKKQAMKSFSKDNNEKSCTLINSSFIVQKSKAVAPLTIEKIVDNDADDESSQIPPPTSPKTTTKTITSEKTGVIDVAKEVSFTIVDNKNNNSTTILISKSTRTNTDDHEAVIIGTPKGDITADTNVDDNKQKDKKEASIDVAAHNNEESDSPKGTANNVNQNAYNDINNNKIKEMKAINSTTNNEEEESRHHNQGDGNDDVAAGTGSASTTSNIDNNFNNNVEAIKDGVVANNNIEDKGSSMKVNNNNDMNNIYYTPFKKKPTRIVTSKLPPEDVKSNLKSNIVFVNFRTLDEKYYMKNGRSWTRKCLCLYCQNYYMKHVNNNAELSELIESLDLIDRKQNVCLNHLKKCVYYNQYMKDNPSEVSVVDIIEKQENYNSTVKEYNNIMLEQTDTSNNVASLSRRTRRMIHNNNNDENQESTKSSNESSKTKTTPAKSMIENELSTSFNSTNSKKSRLKSFERELSTYLYSTNSNNSSRIKKSTATTASTPSTVSTTAAKTNSNEAKTTTTKSTEEEQVLLSSSLNSTNSYKSRAAKKMSTTTNTTTTTPTKKKPTAANTTTSTPTQIDDTKQQQRKSSRNVVDDPSSSLKATSVSNESSIKSMTLSNDAKSTKKATDAPHVNRVLPTRRSSGNGTNSNNIVDGSNSKQISISSQNGTKQTLSEESAAAVNGSIGNTFHAPSTLEPNALFQHFNFLDKRFFTNNRFYVRKGICKHCQEHYVTNVNPASTIKEQFKAVDLIARRSVDCRIHLEECINYKKYLEKTGKTSVLDETDLGIITKRKSNHSIATTAITTISNEVVLEDDTQKQKIQTSSKTNNSSKKRKRSNDNNNNNSGSELDVLVSSSLECDKSNNPPEVSDNPSIHPNVPPIMVDGDKSIDKTHNTTSAATTTNVLTATATTGISNSVDVNDGDDNNMIEVDLQSLFNTISSLSEVDHDVHDVAIRRLNDTVNELSNMITAKKQKYENALSLIAKSKNNNNRNQKIIQYEM